MYNDVKNLFNNNEMSHENVCNIIMTEYVDYVKVLYTSRTDIMVMF